MTDNHGYYYVFVGSYGNKDDQSIQLLLFDSTSGSLRKTGSTSGIMNPSFLTVNKEKTRLYSISEEDPGEIVSFSIELGSGKLSEINRQPTVGSSPCFVSLDPYDQLLFTANYGGGSITVFPLNPDGSISPFSDFKRYTDTVLKKTSHPHQIKNIPNTNKYLITDLGMNRIYLYQFNYMTSQLELLNEIVAVPESGPRHLTLHREQRIIYVANEFNSNISVYTYNEEFEIFELIQEIETTPSHIETENYCSDIHISPCQSYLYVSNRGHNSLATYQILDDGKLKLLGHSLTMGEWPRNFGLVPDGKHILVANQHSDSIVVLKIGSNGIPQTTSQHYSVKSPACLYIINA
ncbi:lactonase family protein [Cytobacillus praedii]|uniref:lactonase family protein n=1 Tax=Cytobacillus praedii TaxID=1742358 RepID=UPI003F7DE212